ncbi:MAG TPA: DinB family protein [Gemmatimonadales bacterium]|jgi:uncharacterized damage-inducible protein DinB|nr:DinB family protein [Gemmatimonadales bacterium]
MDAQVAPLAVIFDLNTDLLLNCLDGLSEAEARRRLAAGGNSIAFLATHLTDSRHFLVTSLGHPLANPLAGFIDDVRSIEEIRELPSLELISAAWLGIGAHLQAILSSLSAAELARTDVPRFPVDDRTVVGMLAFLGQHESYHLGQIGFLRRQLNKPAMSYTRRVPVR